MWNSVGHMTKSPVMLVTWLQTISNSFSSNFESNLHLVTCNYLPESSSSSSSLSAFLAAVPFLTTGVALAGVAFFTTLGGGVCKFKEITLIECFLNYWTFPKLPKKTWQTQIYCTSSSSSLLSSSLDSSSTSFGGGGAFFFWVACLFAACKRRNTIFFFKD